MSTTVNIKMSLDVKKIIKWMTFILIASLFIFPFIGDRKTSDDGKKFTEYINGESLAYLLFQGKLFVLRGAAWLWITFMLAAPIAMHCTKNMKDMKGWIIRTAAAFLAFLGALMLIVVWTETKVRMKDGALAKDAKDFVNGASMLGTWIYMIVSAILCAALAFDGKDYLTKK